MYDFTETQKDTIKHALIDGITRMVEELHGQSINEVDFDKLTTFNIEKLIEEYDNIYYICYEK